MSTPVAKPPFDPTKYAIRRPVAVNPAKESHVEPKSAVAQSPVSGGDNTAAMEHSAEKEHHVKTTKVHEEKSKKPPQTSTKSANEATVGPDSPTSHPEETLRLASLRLVKHLQTLRIGSRYMTFAEIDGWTCLVHHGAFRKGELVLYFENDSFLPAADDRFANLRPLQTFEGKLGYRVKNRNFGTDEPKIVTQGYLYPLRKFPEIWDEVNFVQQVVGATGSGSPSEHMVNLTILAIYRCTNWAERLGIKKWAETQPAQPQLEHTKLGKFPSKIFSRTDITRLQDCPHLFCKAEYKKRTYQESAKKDGTSMTVYFVKNTSRYFKDLSPLPETVGPNTVLDNGRFGVCSKNCDLNELQECGFGYWKTAMQYDLPAKLSKIGCNIAINCELCGDGINGNREGICGGKKDLFVYSMFDIDWQKFVDPRVVTTRAEKLGLKHVPVLGYVKIPDIAKGPGDLQRRADEREGEGLVFKCLEDGRSFKVLSNTYQDKHDL